MLYSTPTRTAALALAVAAGLVSLTGCQSLALNANNSAELRVIDVSPDAGVLDSYQNNSGLAYNLTFGTATTYVPMVPGVYTLSTAKAGTRQTLTKGDVTLSAGRQYTEIVGNIAGNLQQTLYTDQSQPAPAGEFAVRLLNQSTRSGPVDVYLVPKGGRVAGTAPVVVNLSFGANSAYLDLPAGTYSLMVVPTGLTLVPSTLTLMSGPQVTYDSGAVRTVVLIDQEVLGAPTGPLTPAVQTVTVDDADAPVN